LKIPSNSPIDDLLDGGIQTRLLTHVYGSAGSGKTTLALQLSISVAMRGYDVIYFDAEEAFSASRLQQMMRDGEAARVMQRITVSQPVSFDEQNDYFQKLGAKGGKPWGLDNLGVIVVDTITRHYRVEYLRKPRVKVFRELAEQHIAALLKAARNFDVAVLLLNQVSSDVSRPRLLKPVGGDALSRVAKYEVSLQKEAESGIGCATLMKSPTSSRIGTKAEYVITESGMMEHTQQATNGPC
jgi:RecA/RadA recombinase